MAKSETPSEAQKWWSYTQNSNVGIWEIEDWGELFENELDEAEKHYRETANQPDITATLVVFDNVDTLDNEMQTHMTEAWSQLAQGVTVEKTGYVASGITAMAVRSNVEAPETELATFESLDEGLAWAKD